MYIHRKCIIHVHLKPSNILIGGEVRISAKIADFGISKMMSGKKSITGTGSDYGSTRWQAPEVLKGVELTTKVDMFHIGSLLFFGVTQGHHPFGEEPVEQQNNIERNDIVGKYMLKGLPEATDLITSLLHDQPEKRPDTAKTLSHPFFWSAERRLHFFHEASDIEQGERKRFRLLNSALHNSTHHTSLATHKGYLDWNKKVNKDIVTNFLNNLTPSTVVDPDVYSLLRCIRNLHSHFRERPEALKLLLPEKSDMEAYFRKAFPSLLIDVYRSFKQHRPVGDLAEYYVPKNI